MWFIPSGGESMKKRILAASVVSIGVLAACSGGVLTKTDAPAVAADLGHQVLPANDGWAAEGSGTTGGAKATAQNVFTVSSRKDLVAALAKAGDAPKIVYIKGTINLSTDDSGRELFEKDYADPGYNFEAYKKAYDPAAWNRQALMKGKPPQVSGPLEEARERSEKNQSKVVIIHIPSNTSLIGLGKDAKLVKGNLFIGKGADNVIIRNIAFEDAFDYFPQWDPTDSYSTKRTEPVIEFGVNYTLPGCQDKFVDDSHGPQRCNGGRWNSEYDLISINGGTHVWIDHCSFSDGDRLDKQFPPVFAAPYNQPAQKVQHHDGAVDITNQADFITVSYSRFYQHDKLNLIGGSDGIKADAGTLNVTFHDNLYENTKQRQPRVRYGKVHSYNNLFVGDMDDHFYPFAQSIGLGKEAKVLVQNNAYEIAGKVTPSDLIWVFNDGTALSMSGTLLNGKPVDVLADYNATQPKKKVGTDIGWAPAVAPKLMPTADVPAYVRAHAGAGKL
jgi:pectate lyase